MNADKLISEARARIIWGESSASVRDFLISKGISDAVAAAKIKEFILERSAEIRRVGVRNILVGVVLAGAGGIALYVALAVFPVTFGIGGGFNLGVGLVVLAELYALWKLVKGFVCLVRPQSEHKSIPDINQSELIE